MDELNKQINAAKAQYVKALGEVLRVNLGFEQVQADLEKLKKSLRALETESPEAGEKFRAAIKTYLEAW